MRIRITLLTSLVIVGTGLVAGGPLSSGAWLLLLPTLTASVHHPLPAAFEPRHKGHIDYSTGLYIRRDDDLVLDATPPFVLTRTYRSRDRISRHFGVGTTHNGEWYLVGDAERFQWAQLILDTSSRVRFERRSPGELFINALFEHRGSMGDFEGARLGWAGLLWALKWADGRLALFKSCAPGVAEACSISWIRDADGHWTHFARDRSGLLRQIVTRLQRIDFYYDDARRVRRVLATNGRHVSYSYDAGGRLTRVVTSEGLIRSYTYGPNGEMTTIREPGVFIENEYDNGRCIRQVARLTQPDGTERVRSLRLSYTLEADQVTATDVTENESQRSRYEFRDGYHVSETFDDGRGTLTVVKLDRDPLTHAVQNVTVQCTGGAGPIMRTAAVAGGDPDAVKGALLRQCSESRQAAQK